ncbi:hypothetical protein IFR05_015741 [Cadophora sp. M221]|nr:hypothetical protein IFR05_015741 [Cadophora sp. M221]
MVGWGLNIAYAWCAPSKPKLPSDSKLPPGPPGKPFVGNLPGIPPAQSWLEFKEWADKYGPLFRLNPMGRNMIVVSTEKIANDLLQRGCVESTKDPDVRRVLQVDRTLKRVASPGAYFVDSFPLLNYFPKWLAPFKREAEKLHRREKSLFRELLDGVRDRIKSEKCGSCFAKKFLENQDQFGLSDDEGAYALGVMFEARSGTVAAAMMSFCLAMCHYPDWQSKMQREVDEVVGSSRMPTFDDIPSLPTVRAVAKEALRWRPVTAGGIPHELTKDDVYEGFFFPAGSNIMPNQWAIHREEKLYPDPETFNPERWPSADYPIFREPLTKFPNLQNFSAFGFGRRICPSVNIA